MKEAMAYFDEAMEILDTLEVTPENQKSLISLICNQYWVFFLLLKMQKYYELLIQYQPLVVRLDDIELSVKFYTSLSGCEYWIGFFDQSIKTGIKAIELGKACGHPEYAYNGLCYDDI